MSGGSRGIGPAVAVRAAAAGANIALIAKTGAPHPKLPGTIHTAAAEIEAAGGAALPVVGDIRDDATVAQAIERTVERFGGIDLVVNNASAIDTAPAAELPMKRYDLMQDINCRGTYLLSSLAIPALRKSARAGHNPHILTLSPPLKLDPRWAGQCLGYTIAEYGMSLTTLGSAEELRADGIGVDSLWPRTTIGTAAIRNRPGGAERVATSAHPRSAPTPRISCSRARQRAPPGTSSSTRMCCAPTVLPSWTATGSRPVTVPSLWICSCDRIRSAAIPGRRRPHADPQQTATTQRARPTAVGGAVRCPADRRALPLGTRATAARYRSEAPRRIECGLTGLGRGRRVVRRRARRERSIRASSSSRRPRPPGRARGARGRSCRTRWPSLLRQVKSEPPSTLTLAPVIYELRREARKATTGPISSGSPARGIWAGWPKCSPMAAMRR